MSQSILRCKHNVAGDILIAVAILFLLVGCASLYRSLGVSSEQAAQQAAHDQAAVGQAAVSAGKEFVEQIATGTPLPVAAVASGSEFIWQLLTIIATSAGTILTGWLATRLKTEKRITAAMITGVEKAAEPTGVKASIQREATAAGVEPILHARVQELTA